MPFSIESGRGNKIKTASENLYDYSQVNTNDSATPKKPISKSILLTTIFKSCSGYLNFKVRIDIIFLIIVIAAYCIIATKNYYNSNAVTKDYEVVNSIKEEDIRSSYLGNQLENGSSPLTDCYGLGDYQGDLTLTIKNRSNTDAIVCLYSTSLDRTIRNEYVQKNSFFTMFNIAEGYYKIRVFYGNDWNPNLQNYCGSRGNFESDIKFTEFKAKNYLGESTNGYTHTTITLYSDANHRKLTSTIDSAKFFSK